jgi:hypothetical protein
MEDTREREEDQLPKLFSLMEIAAISGGPFAAGELNAQVSGQ